jgi:hypothetical protein
VFPEDQLLLAAFWVSAAGVLGGYVTLFLLARRPVTLRLGRLEWFFLAVLGARLGIILLGYPLETAADMVLFGATLLAAVGCRMGSRVWLVRAKADTLREQLETACRGLFLGCAEPHPGHFAFTAKGGTWHLRMVRLGQRLLVVVLPRAVVPGKIALLVHWLSKQYPGPLPRFHINLVKE